MRKYILVIACLLLISSMVLSVVYLKDKPNLSNESILYEFEQEEDFDISSIIQYGVTAVYIDGHKDDYVWITMKNFPEIKKLQVYKDCDSLIILIDDLKGSPREDRLFTSTEIKGIPNVLDNIKVYRNGKRYYFARSTRAME